MDLIYKLCAMVAAVLIVSVSGCSMQENYMVADMVAHGADPLKASCAMSQNNRHDMCLIVSSK